MGEVVLGLVLASASAATSIRSALAFFKADGPERDAYAVGSVLFAVFALLALFWAASARFVQHRNFAKKGAFLVTLGWSFLRARKEYRFTDGAFVALVRHDSYYEGDRETSWTLQIADERGMLWPLEKEYGGVNPPKPLQAVANLIAQHTGWRVRQSIEK